MRQFIRLFAALLLLLSCAPCAMASSSTQPSVWVVSQSGAGDFSQLSDAVAAAAEGDVIWLRDGSHGPVVVDDKELSIVSLRPDRVHVDRVDVLNLAAGKVLTLSGIGIYRLEYLPEGRGALSILNCEGSVRIQDCVLGWPASPGIFPVWGTGLSVEDSFDVALEGCQIDGGDGTDVDPYAGTGMLLRRSRVSMTACHSTGIGPRLGVTSKGRSGAILIDATLFVRQSQIEGGSGPTDYFCEYLDGGDGLIARGASVIHALDTEFMGGWGGEGYCGFFNIYYGAAGEDMVLGTGVMFDELPSSKRRWSCDNISFDGDSFSVSYLGKPGDQVFLVRGTAGGYEYSPEHLGPWLLSSAASRPASMGIAEGGSLYTQFPLAELTPPAREGAFLLQAYAVSAQGEEIWLGEASLTVLDRQRVAAYVPPIHVDAARAPGGDGTSWDSAFNRLEDGLAAAVASWQEFPVARELWIAEGTYNSPQATYSGYEVESPMRLYGGFAGDELSLDERDVAAHPCVLSADVLGDDGPGFANYDDNASRVLYVYPGAGELVVLDGLTLRGGQGSAQLRGGGMFVEYGVPLLVRDCTFMENRAGNGAGVYLHHFGPSSSQFARFVGCTFRDNLAFSAGGGMFSGGWWVELQRCRFVHNQALQSPGGGLLVTASTQGPLLVQGCEFTRNGAPRGAGMFIYYFGESSARVLNCTISDNRSESAPGGISSNALPGGTASDPVSVENSILWGNSSAGVREETTQMDLGASAGVTPHYCCIEGWSGQFGGQGNIGGDPLLQSDGRLAAGSAAIDAGDSDAVASDSSDLDGDGQRGEAVPIDLGGAPRFVDDPAVPDTGAGSPPVVDMGAHERQP